MSGKKVVITAGGTIEKIDPVRYISNFSSGKMGIALADEVFNKGGEVELITTFECSKPYKTTKVLSAEEMKTVVESRLNNTDVVIMTAAVADYKVNAISSQKIKKTSANNITLELTKNPDILQNISAKKRKGQTIIGFCAESENLLENAKKKIKNKGCDYLIANDISRTDIGFGSNENEIFIIDKEQNIKHFDKASKKLLAKQILEYIFE
jgi:phosphopantothenoylcysteine decarboxylase/phosphopantothenate--cysteine ligase